MIKFHFRFRLEREVSIISNAPTHPNSNKKKNDEEQIGAITFLRSLQIGSFEKNYRTVFITSSR